MKNDNEFTEKFGAFYDRSFEQKLNLLFGKPKPNFPKEERIVPSFSQINKNFAIIKVY